MMPTREEEELQRISAEVARRQQASAAHPKPISDALHRLLARRGYAQQQSSEQWETMWRQTVGPRMAEQSRVGRLRGNVLEVLVQNSAVLQELTFQKRTLLSQLLRLCPNNTIRDIRFRVGDLK
jgi:predicted nucleic acid-binding Zn ribbon protein